MVEAALAQLTVEPVSGPGTTRRGIRVQLERDLVVPLWVPRAVEPGQVYLIPGPGQSGPQRWWVQGFCNCPVRHVLIVATVWGVAVHGKVLHSAMGRPSIRRAEVC